MGDLAGEMRDILAETGTGLGLDVREARLIRLHRNALFALPRAGLLVRIATDPDAGGDAAASLRATRWLHDRGYPCIEPAMDEPLTVRGHPVSVWRWVDAVANPRPTGTEIGRLLAGLHAQPVPAGLRPFGDPLASVAAAVERHPGVVGDHAGWLRARIAELRQVWRAVRWARPPALVHGDAHPSNVLRSVDGRLLLGDWDEVAVGPPEWDLIQVLYFRRRFQHPSAAHVDDLARAYGWDVRAWPHAGELIAMRELHGLAPYPRTASSGAARAEEAAHRLRTLRDGDESARWHSPT